MSWEADLIRCKPDPSDLFSICYGLEELASQDGGKSRRGKNNDNRVNFYFGPKNEEFLHQEEFGERYPLGDGLLEDESIITSVVSRFSGRLATTGTGIWSLRMSEAVFYVANNDYFSPQKGFRINYFFEWSSEIVMRNDRRVHVVDDEDQVSYEEMLRLPDFSDTGLGPDYMGAISSFCAVSKADCGLLIASMKPEIICLK